MDVLGPRRRYGFNWLEATVLVLFCAVLAAVIPHHEPWSDEAQAWLIARDCSLGHIFFHQLHYEGSPGLWHLLLWAATRLHLPYGSLQYISGSLVALGMYVFLRYAPLPLLVRVLVPFTFYFQYQYAVISRSYALFPLSVFLLCTLYTRRKAHPFWFAFVAGLTANESMHGWLFAVGISLAYAIELWRRSKKDEARSTLPKARQFWGSACLLCGLLLFAVYTAIPAPDLHFFFAGEGALSHSAKLRSVITGIPVPASTEVVDPYAAVVSPQQLPSPENQEQPPRNLHEKVDRALRVRLLTIAAFATYPYSTSKLLAWVFILSALTFAFVYGGAEALLPFLLLMAGMVFIHSQDYHAGLLLIALLGVLWLAWNRIDTATLSARGPQAAFTCLLALVLLLQVQWSAHAVSADIRNPYDPALATSRFFKEHAQGKTLVSYYYEPTADEPYFAHEIFANRQSTYYQWSLSGQSDWAPDPAKVLALHPDYIVLSTKRKGSQALDSTLR